MLRDNISRRNFSSGMGALVAGASLAITPESGAAAPRANAAEEITRSHAAIHQEISFAADPAQIYQTLTTAERFDRVVQLSFAMNSMMKSTIGTTPTQIDARTGGAFALFGRYITGFNLELVPSTRIVQAWRVGGWPPGIFSIAKFVLSASGPGTLIVFDHTGFPDGAAEHLAGGWYANYWKPLGKLFRGD